MNKDDWLDFDTLLWKIHGLNFWAVLYLSIAMSVTVFSTD